MDVQVDRKRHLSQQNLENAVAILITELHTMGAVGYQLLPLTTGIT